MNNKMKLLLTLLGASLLQIAAPVDLAAQAPEEDHDRALREEFPDELDRLEAGWAQRQEEMDREFEEWEGEQARRRDEEGENFDEDAFEFERGLMAQRRELEERRMRLDVETTRAYRELDAKFRELEDKQQQYWVQRQRSDMASHEPTALFAKAGGCPVSLSTEIQSCGSMIWKSSPQNIRSQRAVLI